MVENNRVVLVSGATGCGKTTQVPQFVLDSFINAKRGGECNIICTQPRRIAAIGVATRVADERAESIGDVVGYHIRMQSKVSDKTRLLFCTTGVLLRRLLHERQLPGVGWLDSERGILKPIFCRSRTSLWMKFMSEMSKLTFFLQFCEI